MKLKIFDIIICFVIVMSMPFMLKGQDTIASEVNAKKYIQFDFSNGYFRSGNYYFNRALQKEGFNAMSLNMANGSFSLDYFFDKGYVTSLKGYYFFTPSNQKQPNNLESSLDGYGFEVMFGYVIVKKNSWRLYPYAGLGGNATTLRMSNPNRSTASQSLNDLLNDPTRDLNLALAYTGYTLDLGLSFDKMFELKRKKLVCPQITRYLTAGLKIGYYYSAQKVLTQVDEYNLTGFYANLFIGMGTKIRKVRWK